MRSLLVTARFVALAAGLALPLAAHGMPLPTGVGIRRDASTATELATALPEQPEAAARAILRISVRPDESGSSNLANLERALAAAAGRARVVVSLERQAAAPVPSLTAWLEHVSAVGRIAKGRVSAFEIADDAVCVGSQAEDSFALKKSILALREAEPDAGIVFTVGAGTPGDACAGASTPQHPLSADEQEALWPFLDGLASAGPQATPLASLLAMARSPALPSWKHDAGAEPGSTAWARVLGARLADSAVTTVASGDLAPEAIGASFATLLRAIPPEAERLGEGQSSLTWPDGASVPSLGLLVVPSDLSQRLVFGPTPESLRSRAAFAVVRLADRVAAPRIFDPMGALDGPVEWAPESGGISALRLPLVDRPLVLAWDRAGSENEASTDVAVDAVREPSLEEILARHAERRATRQGQADTWSADLVTTMRYQLGGSGRSIEVRIESRYYERADGLKEIENLRFFIDGAPYEPKKGQPPELPLMQPEKVSVVPLDIHLDKSYEYELRGKDQRDGRAAWRIAFRPLAAKADAWSGQAFIDAETFDLLATDVTQTGLEAPILSNQQEELYGPAGSEGAPTWLVREVNVRRVMNIVGSNIIVDMRLTFANESVNDPTFEQRLEEARASDRQMLRDTEQGLKYLRKDESGQRIPVETSTRKIFVIAGLRVDDSYAMGIIPLAGVNIFESDAWGRGLQLNAFLAGAVNSLSISDPSLAGGKTNFTFQAFLPLVRSVDRVLVIDDVDEDTEAAVREPRASVAFGHPFGAHVQGGIELGLSHQSWATTDDTIDSFQVPESTWLASLSATLELHAGGWDGRAAVERSERSTWAAWGAENAMGAGTIETPSAYWKWKAAIGREFRLTPLQTLGLEAEYLGGDDLDRFSQYEFAAFGGPQMPGFEGTGLHFDEAEILRVRWSFSVLGRVGFDVKAGFAHTRDGQLSPAEVAQIGFDGNHVGLALGATFPGPWRTLVRVEIGSPIVSADHEDLAGAASGQILFTKLLK